MSKWFQVGAFPHRLQYPPTNKVYLISQIYIQNHNFVFIKDEQFDKKYFYFNCVLYISSVYLTQVFNLFIIRDFCCLLWHLDCRELVNLSLFKMYIEFQPLHFSMKLHYKFYCPSNAYGHGCITPCRKEKSGHKCGLSRCRPGTENISLLWLVILFTYHYIQLFLISQITT